MLKSKLIPKLEKRLKQIEEKDLPLGLKNYKKEHTQQTIRKLKHYRRTIQLYEKSYNIKFNGTEADVYTYQDLTRHCNELQYGEKPLDLIIDKIFIPIGGSELAPHDLTQYLYLPSGLVEHLEDMENLKKHSKTSVKT